MGLSVVLETPVCQSLRGVTSFSLLTAKLHYNLYTGLVQERLGWLFLGSRRPLITQPKSHVWNCFLPHPWDKKDVWLLLFPQAMGSPLWCYFPVCPPTPCTVESICPTGTRFLQGRQSSQSQGKRSPVVSFLSEVCPLSTPQRGSCRISC